MKKFLISEEEKNRILGMHKDATKRHYLGEQAVTQKSEIPNPSPEITTKIQKIDNTLEVAKQTPTIWANSFNAMYEKVEGADWYLSNGQPAANYRDESYGYVKKGNNLTNFNKLVALYDSGNFKIDGKNVSSSPEYGYMLSSYVSPPVSSIQNSPSKESYYKENGLTLPELDNVQTSALNMLSKIVTNLKSNSLLYGGFDGYTNMKQKIEGQGDRDYSQIESILPTLNNVVKTNENVAKLAKDKLQKPDTIITDKNYVNAVDYLLKKIG
jgi:hypothetical protein